MAKAKVLGPFSGTAWAGRTSEIQHRVPSRRQSLLAATGSLEENTLPLLWCWLSSTVNKVLMLCRYRASTSDFLFHVKWNFRWNWREVVAYQRLAHCFAESFYQSLVSELKIGHRNKTTCSESNPVRKGRLLRFESNDFKWRRAKAWKRCQAQFWIDCNQSLQRNRSQMNLMKCDVASHVVTSLDKTSFYFRFEDFLSNLPM